MGTREQNYINHVVIALDASGSMGRHKHQVLRVVDEQIKHLALRSQELDQETRITLYTFDDRVTCAVYDKDVLRMPSLAQHYNTGGMTAMADATILALDDLAMTPEKYGSHSFLVFVVTDGLENASSKANKQALPQRLEALPDHWTVAALVPDVLAKREAVQFGFPPGNVAMWDATSAQGMQEVGTRFKAATDSFMTARTSGVRGTRSLFSTGADAVNTATVKAANLVALSPSQYKLVPVPRDAVIKDFVESCGYRYQIGKGYYQLSKTETIQATKEIAVVDIKTDQVYTGPDARHLIGLPAMNVRVKPDHNPQYKIYVQSTSVNRKLIAGTRILIMQ